MTLQMGVDVGGTGIKGGVVDLETGALVTDRFKIATPQPATPEAVSETVAEIVDMADWEGPVGCALPSVIKSGIVKTAANIDRGWIDVDGEAMIGRAVGATVHLINDADAAGVAEMRWGSGEGRDGTVLLLTFGTGIGSALFANGNLVRNTELGHLQMWGGSAEARAAAKVREREDLSWEEWAEPVNEYLAYVEWMLAPDTIVFGGGISKKYDEFLHLLRTDAALVPAELQNNAGIAGAALLAAGEVT
ncbi:MAG: ROK family protein [Acidimicrobiia bacterium]|nr:ROK family protein [Acidimicrobiia bacterium]